VDTEVVATVFLLKCLLGVNDNKVMLEVIIHPSTNEWNMKNSIIQYRNYKIMQ